MAYSRTKYEREKVNMHYFTLRLSHDEFAELAIAAGTDGVPIAKMLREFVTWGLENRVRVTHKRFRS